MRKMGGIILVESKNDYGTTFIVEIPQKGGTD
jgi:signal transduction histidine kinase